MITADELDLLTFFECEPQKLDNSAPWYYNDLVYEVVQGESQLTCAIAPAYQDVRITWKHRGILIFEISAMRVEDIKCLNDSGRETLEISITEANKLWLHLKPTILITQNVAEQT